MVTITRIAVPLKVGTVIAAEMICVCELTGIEMICVFELTGILDPMFHKWLCVQKINRCIDTVVKKH